MNFPDSNTIAVERGTASLAPPLTASSGLARRLLGATLALAVLAPAFAQVATVYDEQGELKRGSRTITSLGKDLAGEKIDLYTGSVSVGQIDVSLPGNNELPVIWGRKHKLSAHFGGWDIEIPRISGTFLSGVLIRPTGWLASLPGGTTSQQRCTNYSEPPTAMATKGNSAFEAGEFWAGNRLYVPGQVDELVMKRDPANTRQPTGGGYPLVTKSEWQIRDPPGAHTSRHGHPSREASAQEAARP
jgi:hypothetical protein